MCGQWSIESVPKYTKKLPYENHTGVFIFSIVRDEARATQSSQPKNLLGLYAVLLLRARPS